MKENSSERIEFISDRSIEIAAPSYSEIERCCWMAVHEYRHGALPSEYDIREIDEELYLSVLARAKDKIASL